MLTLIMVLEEKFVILIISYCLNGMFEFGYKLLQRESKGLQDPESFRKIPKVFARSDKARHYVQYQIRVGQHILLPLCHHSRSFVRSARRKPSIGPRHIMFIKEMTATLARHANGRTVVSEFQNTQCTL
jgi:hypothetical protein